MIKVGIIGGAGYTAGELIRILINHPDAELSFVHSESNCGNPLYCVHKGIIGDTQMNFCSDYDLNSIDVLFMCSGHGKSKEYWNQHERPQRLKVIDLAQDFRDESDDYVYGLPEWQKDKIANAVKVANPGCFATCIQLALLPLAKAGLLNGDISVNAITGSTGAGVKPSETTHFSWRNGNISSYKVFTHQHLIEINRNLSIIASGQMQPDGWNIDFVPMRGDFTRGIFATVIVNCTLEENELKNLYRKYYAESAFTFVCEKDVDLKDVINTNKAIIHLQKHNDKLIVTSVLDNLLKGASGQAVQNMNLMFGLDEKVGLRLKASAF